MTGQSGGSEPTELAVLRDRVDRLERQLATAMKVLTQRLTEHGRRLDRLDEPPERRPGHESAGNPRLHRSSAESPE